MNIGDLYINASADSVVSLLRPYLAERGIIRFSITKPNNDNVQTNCPFHKNGQEKKPSFGIRNTDGKCHCFTCGWSGTIDRMISDILLKDDDGDFGRKWLIQNFTATEIETRPSISFERRTVQKCTPQYISDEILDSYRYVHPYMYQRHLTDDIIERFDIGYDKDTECITFPIRDIDGNCVFVARRSVNYKYFNYPSGSEKPVYCADIIKKGNYKTVWIVESFLNCLVCWKHNIPAVALIGTGSDSQYDILKNLPVRKYVLALDPDEAGRKGQDRLRKHLSNHKQLTEIVYPDDRDINDLDDEVPKLKEVY